MCVCVCVCVCVCLCVRACVCVYGLHVFVFVKNKFVAVFVVKLTLVAHLCLSVYLSVYLSVCLSQVCMLFLLLCKLLSVYTLRVLQCSWSCVLRKCINPSVLPLVLYPSTYITVRHCTFNFVLLYEI